MTELKLTDSQLQISSKSRDGKVFLTGLAGSGKTTAALQWIRNLAEQSIPLDSLLILVPQRSLAAGYYDLISSAEFPAAACHDCYISGFGSKNGRPFLDGNSQNRWFCPSQSPASLPDLGNQPVLYGKDY